MKTADRSSLMRVGRRVDYAIRALAYLAAQPPDTVVSKSVIEKKQDIPPYYLSKIMKDLVAGGLVHSQSGCRGGFSLAKSASAISIKEVYEAVEKRLLLMECLEKKENYCQYCSVCTQFSIWEKAQSLLASYLAGISIGHIADPPGLRDRLVQLQA
jgi:Rrf2 family protein